MGHVRHWAMKDHLKILILPFTSKVFQVRKTLEIVLETHLVSL